MAGNFRTVGWIAQAVLLTPIGHAGYSSEEWGRQANLISARGNNLRTINNQI